MQCRNPEHLKAIDDYLDKIVTVIENVCHIALPKINCKVKGKSKEKVLAGWNDEVKPFQESAQFWFAIWVSAGRPLNCELHSLMKSTRNRYHFMVRKCRKYSEKIKSNKLLEACLDNNKNIFDELKKLRKCNNDDVTSIDGCSTNVENHFADIYEHLYTSVDDSAEVDEIREVLEMRLIV